MVPAGEEQQMNGLHVIQYPTGCWGFVGRVPVHFSYDTDPSMHSVIAQVGPGMARKIAANRGLKFKTIVFETREQAVQFAADHGHPVAA